MNIAQFRIDFLARQKASGTRQRDISSQFGIQQAALSRFAAGRSGLSFESVVKLWPFVYGCEFPPASHNVLSAKSCESLEK